MPHRRAGRFVRSHAIAIWAGLGTLALVLGFGFLYHGQQEQIDQLAAQQAQLEELAQSNKKTTEGLCEIRGSLEDELTRQKLTVARIREYVRRFPDGFNGFSAAEIRRSRDEAVAARDMTEQRLEDLSDLDCPPE